jgi:mannose-6-phosphate isomerase-like protein (cupin superfamily)
VIEKVNLAAKFDLFGDQWSPKIVAEVGDQYLKLVKVQGEFVWHQHETEDELFYVVRGRLVIRLRDGDVELSPGELAVIPRGVEHLPMSDEETHVLLIEPKTTRNTGDVDSDRTVEVLDRI